MLVALALTMAACSGGEATDRRGAAPATTEGRAGGAERPGTTGPDEEDGLDRSGFPVPDLAWEACGAGMQCSTLEVPLDWDDPEGETIELAVARRPATGPSDEHQGILAINPGGPGASGIQMLRSAGLMGMDDLNRWFDIVSWDPRGVAGSTPAECDDDLLDELRSVDPDPDDDAEQDDLDAVAEAYADSCAEVSGDLIEHLGTDQTVADLDLLRAALGEDQLSWLGFSYGTYLGQVYAERYPQRVRAMVLDGVVDPADGLEGLLTAQAEGFETFLDETFAECDADPDCPVDDPTAVLDELLVRSESDPLPAGTGDLDPSTLLTALFASSYDPILTSQLLRGLAQADEEGDGTILAGLAQTYWTLGDYPPYVATLCADVEHPAGAEEARAFAERIEAAAPTMGAAVANEILPCAWLPTQGRAPAPIRAEGAPTILVVGNTGDVATPVEQAERVAEALDDAVLLVHEGEGHTSFGSSACVDEAVLIYLVDLEPPAEGTVCER